MRGELYPTQETNEHLSEASRKPDLKEYQILLRLRPVHTIIIK